jgi:hypothetical protein
MSIMFIRASARTDKVTFFLIKKKTSDGLLELFKEAGADTDTATTMALDMLFAGLFIFIKLFRAFVVFLY